MTPLRSERGKTNAPFDIVHLAQTTFPDDPRPRREAMIAAQLGARTAIVVLGGESRPRVGHYGPVVVIRLPGTRRRGGALTYLFSYVNFVSRCWALVRSDPRFRRASLFHIHTLPDFLVAATGPARRLGARVILDLHEVFPEFTRSKFGGIAGRVGERIARWLERWSRRRADVVLTVNHAVERQLARRPARANERIAVIHNFADPGEFGPPREPGANASEPVRLVYHGTLTPLYGLDLAVLAVARAVQAGRTVTLDIYGDGPAAPSLRAQVAELKMEGVVRLRGIAPHHTLRELLPTYDAGLVPTRLDVMTRFSLSTKLLEYIHLGLPVIIPAIPTYQEYIPEPAAWYFAPNSAESMAEAIIGFVAAPTGERNRRAQAAQAASATRIDPARDAEELRRLYRELLPR